MTVFARSIGPRRCPLAIHPLALDIEYEHEEREEYDERRDIDEGIAHVDIRGPLAQFASMCWDGYDAIIRRFACAIESEAPGVLVTIGSPGGEVEGLFEACRVMRQMASKSGKPVVAYVDESAYSAAYAIACVADAIYLPPAGGVGSIGVIGELVDVSRANDAAGVRVEVVTSGDEKADGHPAVPLSDATIGRAQRRIDQLAGLFFDWVSMRRGMRPSEVDALQAACVYAEGAIAAGLADGIRSRKGALRAVQALAGMGAPAFTTQPTMTPSQARRAVATLQGRRAGAERGSRAGRH